jgi:hypothetical protein
MKRAALDEIIGFLRFSPDHSDRLNAIEKFEERQWKYLLRWLDDAGLAFYFLRRLKDANAGHTIPPWVLTRLERNFTANHLRMQDMTQRFAAINDRFNGADVHYAAIKGFSLIPQYCPYAPLRHQADLDYFVDDQSLPMAHRMLVEAGYRPQASRASKESIYVFPGGAPIRGDEQYLPQTAHAVELHTDIWDSNLLRLPPIPGLFSVAQAKTQHWNGLAFPALQDKDVFLLQVLHACRHLFTQWIRMSCLFEIGYFQQRRATDSALWDGIEDRVGNNAILREFVVVVTEMAARLFAAPVPELAQRWGARIRPGPRTWIEHYARNWAAGGLPVYEFSLFPRAKLVVFLHRQYKVESGPQPTQLANQAASSRLSRMAVSLRNHPWLLLRPAWWRRQQLFRRSMFYALAGLRYAVEIPRWHWRNRASRRVAAVAPTREPVTVKKAS